MERTANHPFLLQLIASRLFESRDLGATLDQVAADEMVANFFSVDFQTLDPDGARDPGGGGSRRPRAAARELAQAAGRTRGGGGAAPLRPAHDGLPDRGGRARTASGNWFFERWLRRVVRRPRTSRGAPVIVGVNRVFAHGGKDYHIQAEDLGVEQAASRCASTTRAPCSGASGCPTPTSWRQGLRQLEQDEALRALMEKTLHTVQAAIAKGKLA